MGKTGTGHLPEGMSRLLYGLPGYGLIDPGRGHRFQSHKLRDRSGGIMPKPLHGSPLVWSDCALRLVSDRC